MQRFTDKVIWITGASSGIGEAMAKAFHAEGAKVILSSRKKDALENVQASMPTKHENIAIVPLDLAEVSTFGEATKSALAAFGKIDIMIHNAGISQRMLAIDTAFEEEAYIIQVNLLGTIALNKQILPHFMERNQGQIVVISSVMGKIATPYRSSYAASKHGLVGYFDSLRMEIGDKITITHIMPGFVDTHIVKNAISKQFNPDNQNKKGMPPAVFAQKALTAIAHKRKEVYIGGIKEWFALFSRQYLPAIFHLLIKRAKVV